MSFDWGPDGSKAEDCFFGIVALDQVFDISVFMFKSASSPGVHIRLHRGGDAREKPFHFPGDKISNDDQYLYRYMVMSTKSAIKTKRW